MDREDLIKIITEEVLRRLKIDIREEYRKVLFIGKEDEKYKYSSAISDWSNIVFTREYKDIDPFQTIIFPFLSNRDLVDISLGKEESLVSSMVIEGIMKGKKIIILDEGIYFRKFKESSNVNFYSMLEEYIEKIKSFGVIISKGEDLMNHINNEEKNQNSILNLREKNLITQIDLEKYSLKKDLAILINEKTIITSLAMDMIKENRWEIKRVNS
jgi:ethanolamine utilization protein